MYLPEHFSVENSDEIDRFIEVNSFGQLISQVDGRLFSSHLPFMFGKGKKHLLGHLALQNPQHLQIADQEVLITFQGAHDYISPSWFSTPGVPTWNYQAVHVYGRCQPIHEKEQKAAIVDGLTNKHEANLEQPWQPDYREAMLSAIVGLEITVTEIQCKYKLSQNRVKQDQRQIKHGLLAAGSQALADLMDRE